MKLRSLVIVLFAFITTAQAQEVTYSEILKDDNRNMNFEILGNFGGNYLIYKNITRKHRLAIYDNSMTVIKEVKLDFISDKTFNVDFITYPDFFYIIYQYQKGSHIYCNAAKLDGQGNMLGPEIALDTTKISFWADNKIYYLANSEDKKRILLYRMLRKSDTFTLTTSLFDNNLKKLDSTNSVFEYNDRKETYGDLEVDNDGVFYFTRETSRNRTDYISKLDVFYYKPGTGIIISKNIDLQEKFIENVNLKVDNLNKRVFINSLLYKKNIGSIDGMFTVLMSKDTLGELKRAMNIFDDSIRNKLTDRGDWKTAFDDFYLRNVILKKDSGILISMEEYYTQNRGYNSNRFNSPYYYDPFPYSASSLNYYRFQRSYYDPYYYRGDNFRNSDRNLLYNYTDILLFNFTKDLKIQWSNIINKKQSDLETDNFLSYSTINMGSEIHYLFVDKNKQVISDFALQPNGDIKRYATIKSGEVGYSFMPKLAKQVSSRVVIVPCVFRNSVAFARIDFSQIP